MAQVINTNVQSLNAQRNLNNSALSLATSLQRLSSGLRINSAKDDAAGLAISERFSTQIRGLNVAVRNANDGISLSQTAEGALGEISNNLQRIRELAVQARNATNSASDRAALNAEVQQRLAEIDRTASQTSFNGQKILDGSFGTATFQVGSNAGETIGLNLDSSTRIASIGKISSAISNALGATASGGTYSVNVSNTQFGTAGTTATAGNTTATFVGADFTAADAGSSGEIAFTLAQTDFSNGRSVTFTPGSTDFSGANIAQFDVTIGTSTVGITLNQTYADEDALAAAIQSQINAVGGLENVEVRNDAGDLTIVNVGGTDAVAVSGTDANAQNAALLNLNNAAGTAGSAQPNAVFQVDGIEVVLDQAYVTNDDVRAAIESQIQAAGGAFAAYTVAENAGEITISNGAAGGAAVTISAANASANTGGITNATGTAGDAVITTDIASFDVDGTTINLSGDYGDFATLQAFVQGELDDASPGIYDVAVSNAGVMTITRLDATGSGSTAPVVDGFTGTPFTGAPVGLAGVDATPTTNASFQIDGTTINLTQNFADEAALRTAIGTQLGSGYTVSGSGTEIIITNNTPGSAAVTLANADPNAFNSGFVNGSGTAGEVQGAITLATGELTVTDATGTTFDLEGTYTNVQQLADAVNSNLSGVFGSADGLALQIRSAQEFSVGGTQAAALGFTPGSTEVNDGALSSVNVLTTAAADEAILRVDSALQSVSALRSDFGAIQNRFESTIANLQGTAENLAASRSRILDADFAAETANLTRAQILQQAGVAILAQANQLPQNVLSLLR